MTADETSGLEKIRRKRRYIWFWMFSFLPVLWIAGNTIHRSGTGISISVIWAIGCLGSVARVIFSRCPRCANLFFSTNESPAVRNLFARKCLRCGLVLKPERVIYPSLE